MADAPAADRLDEGRRALEGARWAEARRVFESVLEDGEDAEALDGLAQARWFEGDVPEGIALRERAFDAFARAGRCNRAARAAVWVSHQHLIGGRASAARGWLARAERAMAGMADCEGQGWIAVERAWQAESAQEQADHARRALEIARRHRSWDLEVFALSLLGRAEVAAGRREAGLLLLDEAMASASSGDVRDVHTLGSAYCNLITACASAGDWERATEWCAMVDGFAREHAAAPLFGACRTVHAEVLVATGRWAEAERSLEAALEAHGPHITEMVTGSVALLADLRIRQGRLSEAERLLAGREEEPAALLSLARLRLAEGRPHVAAALLDRGLLGAGRDASCAAELLGALVEVRLAAADRDGAADAAARLRDLAGRVDLGQIAARAHLAAAQVAGARGEACEAAEEARRALAAFGRLSMPLEAGEARLELARAVRDAQPEVAAEEARCALGTFRDLGAARAMDRAAALLRDLGTGTAGRARTTGELTAREVEVLDLLGLGLSNAGIAETLCISEKTAGHHVSRILAKLGVRNRAQAAAHAARAAAAA